MKKLALSLLGLILAYFFLSILFYEGAITAALENRKTNPTGLIEIHASKKAVSIAADNAALSDLLRKISNVSGMDFKIPDSLSLERVTAEISALNWEQAIKKLLKDYDRVEIWGDTLDHSQVILLGKEDINPPGAAHAELEDVPQQVEVNKSTSLSESQLKVLASGPLRGPIPSSAMDDPVLHKFLQEAGIHSPEDLKDRRKAMTVRLKAQKALREMR